MKIYIEGTPCAVKVARTVWNGGKVGDDIKDLPIVIKDLKNLNNGDEIIYETKYGKRTYVVTSTEIIGETDFSTLQYTSENRLTLITCVNGSATERYSVVAVEK